MNITEPVMSRTVQCVKLGKEAEGLAAPPYPGELGKRIYLNISKEAWQQWMGHQTILINENRLSALDPKAQAFLKGEMERFLFGDGGELPEQFVSKA
jgi:Fe-S cluster biosynthesis and repair protein YggX